MSCQLQYNPRSVKYVGWQDYEGNERFWAWIDSLVPITMQVISFNFRWRQVEELIAYRLQ